MRSWQRDLVLWFFVRQYKPRQFAYEIVQVRSAFVGKDQYAALGMASTSVFYETGLRLRS